MKCPFKSALGNGLNCLDCDEEKCALWMNRNIGFQYCAFKELALQLSGIHTELHSIASILEGSYAAPEVKKLED